jgi:hypothetical protein
LIGFLLPKIILAQMGQLMPQDKGQTRIPLLLRHMAITELNRPQREQDMTIRQGQRPRLLHLVDHRQLRHAVGPLVGNRLNPRKNLLGPRHLCVTGSVYHAIFFFQQGKQSMRPGSLCRTRGQKKHPGRQKSDNTPPHRKNHN